MVQVDLHMHTTRSDGRLSPTQLVNLNAKNGLRVISITDHDTTDGLDEADLAAKLHPGLRIIPGVEISCDVEGGEVHILAYHVNRHDPQFQKELERFRAGRYERGRMILAKLEALGMPLEWNRVLEIAGDASIGRPHVARAMIEKGYVRDNQEAFDRFLGRNGPAYAEREKLTPEEAIGLARKNGALAVLAHPIYVKDVEKHLPSMRDAGLVGMEVFYSKNSPQQVQGMLEVANRFGLLPLGGSDYHAIGYEGEPEPGAAGPPMEFLERLEALRAKAR